MNIDIQVILAMPKQQFSLTLSVSEGTLAREAVVMALKANLVGTGEIDIDPLTAPLGIFNERIEDDQLLIAGDRVEIYRPLLQDPMELRRQRARTKSR